MTLIATAREKSTIAVKETLKVTDIVKDTVTRTVTGK